MTKPKRPLLWYHGGKWMLAPWIISHFPEHRVYCEPFGGGGSVLLRKKRSYAEIYNDLDTEIVNLFKVVRNNGVQLAELLKHTPFSRNEFNLSYENTEDEIERARRTVVRSFMGFSSVVNIKYKTGFRGNAFRQGTVPAHDWKNYSDSLTDIIERLQGVIIECRDANKVMKYCDSKDTLYYLDPPYLLSTRYKKEKTKCYSFEMTDKEHESLCHFIKKLKGMVIISGYYNDLYNDILSDWHFETYKTFADGAKDRVEVLWMNPAVVEKQAQLKLF